MKINVFQKFILFTVFGSLMISCTSDDNSTNIQTKTIETQFKSTSSAMIEFETTLKNVSLKVAEIVKSEGYSKDPESYEETLNLAMAPLVVPSRKLITEAKITSEEAPAISTLTDLQTIQTGLLIYTHNTVQNDDPSVLDCVARAFVGLELHEGFWGSFATRRALVTAIGKVASRYLGAIGVALIVYDFTDCMGWI
ncbi:hypothetical protein ABS768_16335 [Flavobacterium sp. ST-75]|uniref:Lipoprotein n=1 Tax=Flavobacterium rhizophilum TaxID=3163296 RepID=A0ABW8YHW5_9FLAO